VAWSRSFWFLVGSERDGRRNFFLSKLGVLLYFLAKNTVFVICFIAIADVAPNGYLPIRVMYGLWLLWIVHDVCDIMDMVQEDLSENSRLDCWRGIHDMTVPLSESTRRLQTKSTICTSQPSTLSQLKPALCGPLERTNREYFLVFYRAFYGLFLHTRKLPGMESYSKEKQVMMWFKISGPISPRRIEIGLDLFAEYQAELLNHSIVSVSR